MVKNLRRQVSAAPKTGETFSKSFLKKLENLRAHPRRRIEPPLRMSYQIEGTSLFGC
jgi:hypothetical protein